MFTFKLFRNSGLMQHFVKMERNNQCFLLDEMKNQTYKLKQCQWLTTAMPSASIKEIYQRNKPICNIGTIGHVNHGKTTLTSAITKILAEKKLAKFQRIEDIDKTPNEKELGLSINVSYVDYSTENRCYSHTDCPGHTKYTKNMIFGVAPMDGAILVVDAKEGLMPQTREHLIIAKHMGITHIVAFINKADTANAETLELLELELRDLITKLGFPGDDVPVIIGSALHALQDSNSELGKNSIMKLLNAIDQYVPIPVRDLNKPFFFPIENIYSITGIGTVIAGRLDQGIVRKGMECELVGYNDCRKSVITGLEMFNKTLEEGQAGDQLRACLNNVKRDDIKRGMVMCKPGTAKAYDHCEAEIHFFNVDEVGSEIYFSSCITSNIFSKTWDCDSFAIIKNKEMVSSGEDAIIELYLRKSMIMEEDQNFIIRSGTKTIGNGIIRKIIGNLTEEERKELEKTKKKYKKERKQ